MMAEGQNSQIIMWLTNFFAQKSLNDDFDEFEIQNCIERISENPQNYRQCCEKCLGKGKKIRLLIEQLKNNEQFKIILNKSNSKPTHQIILKEQCFGTDKNFLCYVKFETFTCNLNKIIATIDSFENNLISKYLKESKNLLHFFKLIEVYFIDFIMRKLDVSELIFTFNKLAISHKEINPQIRSVLKDLTSTDFIAILSKFYISKTYLGILFNKVCLPLPILFLIKTDNGNRELYQPELLEAITLSRGYYLITNIGRQDMVDKGKTKFIQEFYHLKKQFLNLKNSDFHEGAINIYSNVSVQIQQKSLMIADFQGSCINQFPQYQELLLKSLKLSLITFIHISENQISKNQDQFREKYGLVLKSIMSKNQVIILIRDCKKDKEINLFGFQTFWIPKIGSDLSPTISLIFQQMNKYIQGQKFQTKQMKYPSFLQQSLSLKYLQSDQKIMEIMNIFKNHTDRNTFYEKLFPNLNGQYCKFKWSKQIEEYEQKQAMKIEGCNECIMQIEKIKQKQEQLKKKIKQKSFLISKVFSELSNKTFMLGNLADELTKWRNQQTFDINKEYILKSAQLSKLVTSKIPDMANVLKLQSEVKLLSEKLQSYDVSNDTIFSEVISLTTLDENGRPINQYTDHINRYYKQSQENVVPINIIQGKTLQFGNIFLQKFMEELNKTKYFGKQVYVVSVIGAQSSAKSTLLNYLFKCNFATSAGRCTKGVYFTIAECNGKTIIVIDTQGLMALVARDSVFDVQIASFVMIISDLVIINNKGQITSTLRDLLGVCIYTIHELNKRQSFKANKIIFALRDQTDCDSSKQIQMLSNIITSLGQQKNINFADYMDFTAEDVFPLQSAFMTQNTGLLKIEQPNNCFGKSILALRSIIVDTLKQQPKHKSIYYFYYHGKQTWNAILKCGRNIFNFKSMFEIQKKIQMENILINLRQIQNKSYRQEQKKLISNFQGKLVEKQEFIQQQLRKMALENYKKFLNTFQQECKKICNEQDWIKSFTPEIKQTTASLHKICLDRFNQDLGKQKESLQKNKYFQQISILISKLYIEGKSGDAVLKQLDQLSLNLEKQTTLSITNIQNSSKLIGSKEMFYNIRDQVKKFLEAFNKGSNFMKMQALEEQFAEIKKFIFHPKDNTKKLIQKFMNIYKTYVVGWITDGQYSQIFNRIQLYVKTTQEQINYIIKHSKITKLEHISEVHENIKMTIQSLYEQFSQWIKLFQQNWTSSRLEIKNKSAIVSWFYSLLPSKFEMAIWENLKTQQQQQLTNRKQDIQLKKRQVIQSIKLQGNFKQISHVWIKKIIDYQIQQDYKLNQTMIEDNLDSVSISLRPQSLIKQALSNTIDTNNSRIKQRWVNCYKIITNINRYIREEIFWKSTQIRNLKNQIAKVRDSMIKNIYQNKLKQIYNKIDKEVNQYDNRNTLKYYENLFKIDLTIFQLQSHTSHLKQIILTMKGQMESHYNKDFTYISKEVHEKMILLKKQSDQFIKDKLEPKVIGCQSKCPGCRMKCKKAYHTDGPHQASQDSHLMACFAGFRYTKSKIRAHTYCYSPDYINSKIQVGETTYPALQWLKKFHPEWYEHFVQQSPITITRQNECNIIWAHIGQMMIKYKYPSMLNDATCDFIKQNQLNQQDMIQFTLIDYQKDLPGEQQI